MAAGDRSKKIISRVRIRLKAISVTDIQDPEILDFGNEIQTDLMVRLRCTEIAETVTLVDGTGEYDLNNYQARIKEIIPSWTDGVVTYVDNAQWREHKDATSSQPIYATVFGNQLYLAPDPAESGLTLILWIHQKMYTAEMSETVDPETPQFLDLVLETGILSLYIPEKFGAKYEQLIKGYSPTTHQKQNVNYKVSADWVED